MKTPQLTPTQKREAFDNAAKFCYENTSETQVSITPRSIGLMTHYRYPTNPRYPIDTLGGALLAECLAHYADELGRDEEVVAELISGNVWLCATDYGANRLYLVNLCYGGFWIYETDWDKYEATMDNCVFGEDSLNANLHNLHSQLKSALLERMTSDYFPKPQIPPQFLPNYEAEAREEESDNAWADDHAATLRRL